jgi:hypothetical protein
MTSHIPENSSGWLVDGSPMTINGKTMPPRDPNDDDEDVDDEDEDEDDEKQPEEPAVVREPDDE